MLEIFKDFFLPLAIGAGGAISVAAFLGKTIVKHALSKELEELKERLSRETEYFKNRLSVVTHGEKDILTRINEERINTLKDSYDFICDAHSIVKAAILNLRITETPDENDVNQFNDELMKARNAFIKSQLSLEKGALYITDEEFFKLNSKIGAFQYALPLIFSSATEVSYENQKEKNDEILLKLSKSINEFIIPKKLELANMFRNAIKSK